jgi:hypothetical protein
MTPEGRAELRASYRETALRYASEPECVAYKEAAGGLALLDALDKAEAGLKASEWAWTLDLQARLDVAEKERDQYLRSFRALEEAEKHHHTQIEFQRQARDLVEKERNEVLVREERYRAHANEGWELCNKRTAERTAALALLYQLMEGHSDVEGIAAEATTLLEETKYMPSNHSGEEQ